MCTLPRRYPNKKYYILAGVGYYLITVLKQFFGLRPAGKPFDLIMSFAMIAYMILILLLMFCTALYKKVLYFGMFCFFTYVTELPAVVLVMCVFKLTPTQLTSCGTINSTAALLSKLLLIVVCKLFFFNGVHTFITKLYENKEILPLIMVNKNTYISAVEKELEQSRRIEELMTSLRQLKHDISLHARVMQELYQKGCYNELGEYMNTTFVDAKKAESTFTCSDPALSATMEMLVEKTKDNEIHLSKIIMVEDFMMPSKDICSIVSNMVNNAIEAVIHLEAEERQIALEAAEAQGGYYINCMNTFKGELPKWTDTYQTSKKDEENHGLGISIIRKTAEKYGGVVKVIPHKSCFEINCFIPDRRKGGEGQKYGARIR